MDAATGAVLHTFNERVKHRQAAAEYVKVKWKYVREAAHSAKQKFSNSQCANHRKYMLVEHGIRVLSLASVQSALDRAKSIYRSGTYSREGTARWAFDEHTMPTSAGSPAAPHVIGKLRVELEEQLGDPRILIGGIVVIDRNTPVGMSLCNNAEVLKHARALFSKTRKLALFHSVAKELAREGKKLRILPVPVIVSTDGSHAKGGAIDPV